jgi:hypothetical protein
MKVVVYSVRPFEKEFLARANQKKHDITLISNALTSDTAIYAQGKDAVVIFTSDEVSAWVINQLADLGIRYIATRSTATDHIDKEAAAGRGIKLANVPLYSPPVKGKFCTEPAVVNHQTEMDDMLTDMMQQMANQTIRNLDQWQQNKCIGKACVCAQNCRVAKSLPGIHA